MAARGNFGRTAPTFRAYGEHLALLPTRVDAPGRKSEPDDDFGSQTFGLLRTRRRVHRRRKEALLTLPWVVLRAVEVRHAVPA